MTEGDASGRRWLDAAALLSFVVAAVHLGAIAVGPRAYDYLGAGDLGRMAERGSTTPALVTAGLTGIFAVFGVYALSGAGRVRRLPLLVGVLVAIGIVYTLRGALFPFEVAALLKGTASFPPRFAVFSAASLFIGLAYLTGTARAWGRLHGG